MKQYYCKAAILTTNNLWSRPRLVNLDFLFSSEAENPDDDALNTLGDLLKGEHEILEMVIIKTV